MIVRDRKDAAEGDEDPATGQVRPPADGRRFAFWAAIVAAVVLAIVLKLGFAPFIATFNGLQRVAADITRPTAPVETATPAGPGRPAPAPYD